MKTTLNYMRNRLEMNMKQIDTWDVLTVQMVFYVACYWVIFCTMSTLGPLTYELIDCTKTQMSAIQLASRIESQYVEMEMIA